MFVERVKALLKEKNIFAKDMLQALGINKNQLSRWENNQATPKPMVLKSIADYLETTPEYLLGETDIKEKKSPITENFTFEELEIINAYRNQPEVARKVVRRALGLEGISPDAATAAYGGKDMQVGKPKE